MKAFMWVIAVITILAGWPIGLFIAAALCMKK